MLENGSDICNCKKTNCVRHSNCAECIEHHKESKRFPIPYCKWPKRNAASKKPDKSKDK